MNRRSFVLTSTLGAALIGKQAVAQRTSATTSGVSQLTGGVVDYSGSQLTLDGTHIDDSDGSEHFHFLSPEGSKFELYFWPTAQFTSRAMVDGTTRGATSVGLQIQREEHYEDGGWVLMNLIDAPAVYIEYQMGAYSGHDLITIIWDFDEEFDFIVAEAQQIMVDNMPPMLFTDLSGVEPGLASSGETGATSTGSNAGGSSGSQAVSQVKQHQQDFYASYDDLNVQVETYTSDSSSKDQADTAFFNILNISAEWFNAKGYSRKVVFAADEAELQSLYFEWADKLSAYGTALEHLALGADDNDEFIEADALFFKVDAELVALLATMANAGSRLTRRPNTAQSRIARSSLQNYAA